MKWYEKILLFLPEVLDFIFSQIQEKQRREREKERRKALKQLLAFIGSLLLLLGAFLPITTSTLRISFIYKPISFILFAILSFIFLSTESYRGLWITAFGSLGIISYIFIKLNFYFSFGLIILIIGAGITLIAAALKIS